jgi:hypothetical protein
MKKSLPILAGAFLAVCMASVALAAPPDGKGNGNAYGKGRKTTTCSSAQAAPTISGTPATSTVEGIAYSFRPTAADANCDPLSFSIDGKPAWASFNASTGQLSGTPPAGTAGLYPYILISVSDGYSATVLPAFSISVQPNTPPSINGTPSPTRLSDGQAFSFAPSASDPDGQALRYSIANKPAWASFSSSTGQLSGTPSASDVGVTQNVAISVSDGLATAALAPFSLEVYSANVAPVISGSPPTSAEVGKAYAFRPTASDANGDTLSFGISNRPTWAVFDPATGQVSGTPASGDAGTWSNIVISVTDGRLTASLAPFGITVSSANSAPRISGTPPASTQVGMSYLFKPVASDPDGDPLRFSIANKPAWAVFDATSGQLSGTPAASDAGTYSNIVISVSDGKLSASLAAFSIAVQQASTGSVTLSWQPPATRTDGTALTNLAGYRIRYGTSAGTYPYVVTLNNAGLTSYVVESLPAGTYYFVMTAFDSAGVESAATNPVSKTVN